MAFPRRVLLLVIVVTIILVLFLHLSLQFHIVVLDIDRFASGPRSLATQLCELLYRTKASPTSSSARPFIRRIVAVGDIHGDMQNARRVLRFSGVVDENGDWTGNTDFFVQTGDIIDR